MIIESEYKKKTFSFPAYHIVLLEKKNRCFSFCLRVHALHLYTLNALSNLGRLCILDPISKKKID
jgi:hypothetical protein